MNKYSRCIVAIIAVATLFGSATSVFAAEEKEVQKCEFTSSKDSLSDSRKKSDGSINAIKDELTIRKEMLRQIIVCAKEDVTILQKNVKDLSSDDKEIILAQKRIVEELQKAISFYDSQEKFIDSIGLKGSKDIAKNIKDWRIYSYNPLAGNAGNLIMWNKNQPLFNAAEKRLEQISQMVKSLKLIEEEEIAKSFESGSQQLSEALKLNTAARNSLVNGAQNEEVSTNIKKSLEILADTYKTFFELSESVKKILPI